MGNLIWALFDNKLSEIDRKLENYSKEYLELDASGDKDMANSFKLEFQKERRAKEVVVELRGIFDSYHLLEE